MQYYLGSSYFKEILGDLELDRLLGVDTGTGRATGNFGIALSPDNIEAVIVALKQNQLS